MDRMDFERLIGALSIARGAFPPESELRRMENLPMLRMWDGLHRLEAAVRTARSRHATASTTATSFTTGTATRQAD